MFKVPRVSRVPLDGLVSCSPCSRRGNKHVLVSLVSTDDGDLGIQSLRREVLSLVREEDSIGTGEERKGDRSVREDASKCVCVQGQSQPSSDRSVGLTRSCEKLVVGNSS